MNAIKSFLRTVRIKMTAAADFIWVQWFSCCTASEQTTSNHRIRIDRSMIGKPMNFQHTVHIGSQGSELQNGQLTALQRQLCSKGGYATITSPNLTS